MEVVMRRIRYIFLAVFCYAMTIYAQPVLKVPVSSQSAALTTSSHVTFKWGKVVTATLGYEIYITSTLAEATSTTIPLATNVGKSKRYVQVGTTANDTTKTLTDTSLVANTVYAWRVRTKTGASTFSAWSAAFYFKTPASFVAVTKPATGDTVNIGSGYVVWTNNTGAAVTKITASYDNESTYPDTLTVSSTAAKDSALFSFKGKSTTSSACFVKVFNANDAGKSTSFYMPARVLAVTTPASGDTVGFGSQYVKWTNNTGDAVTKITVSYDNESTYPDTVTVNRAGAVDSALFTFKGKSTVSGTCFVKVFNSTDAGKSSSFTMLARTIAVTKPAAGALAIGQSYVVWTNNTGDAVTKIAVSYDAEATYQDTLTVNSTASTDSAQYNFKGKTTSSAECYVKVFNSTDAGKSASFSMAGRAIAVTKPAAGALAIGTSNIIWTNNTGSAVTKIKISYDGGTTYSDSLDVNSADAADTVAYNFQGKKTASPSCYVIVYNAQDTGKSASFSMGKGGAVFSMPTVYGDPAGVVTLPISVLDNLANDSVKAFDIKLVFDSTFVNYVSVTNNASIANWATVTDTGSVAGSVNKYLRVSAFKAPTGVAVKNSVVFTVNFTVKPTQGLIGQTSTLAIVNSVLAAAGNGAYSLDVSGSSNGSLKIYSSITGNIHYLHEKWDESDSYTISGDSLIVYHDSTNNANNSVWNVTAGAFNLTKREPNDTINFYPSASKYSVGSVNGLDEITVTDAMAAFQNWKTPLSIRALIAADVNEDSLINTTDAMAIMEISVDSTYLTGLGFTNWVFVDSASLDAFESSDDSLTNWYTMHKHSLSYKLVAQRTNQNFFGVLRGDADFSYSTAAVNTLKKSNATPVIFNTDANFNLRPGDTVWIPLNLTLNENSVAGFNASMKVDPKIFTYTGQFKMSNNMPADKNWYVTARADANGTLRVAGIDFSSQITPITQDGAALLFKYVVNKSAKLGTISQIDVKTQTVVDTKMQKMPSVSNSSRVEISRMGSAVVTEFALSQNYPNPFNPSTTIEFALPISSQVDIAIYNILGQKVATLFNGYQTTGYHQVEWNASNFGSGVYFYKITATSETGSKFQSVKKLMLMK